MRWPPPPKPKFHVGGSMVRSVRFEEPQPNSLEKKPSACAGRFAHAIAMTIPPTNRQRRMRRIGTRRSATLPERSIAPTWQRKSERQSDFALERQHDLADGLAPVDDA